MEEKNSRYVVEEVTVYYANTMEEVIYALAYPNKVKWLNNFKVIDYGSDEQQETHVSKIQNSKPEEQESRDKDSIN